MTESRVKQPKPGWKTTEFWITIATAVGLITADAAGVVPTKEAALLITISGVAYKIARGLAKL